MFVTGTAGTHELHARPLAFQRKSQFFAGRNRLAVHISDDISANENPLVVEYCHLGGALDAGLIRAAPLLNLRNENAAPDRQVQR